MNCFCIMETTRLTQEIMNFPAPKFIHGKVY